MIRKECLAQSSFAGTPYDSPAKERFRSLPLHYLLFYLHICIFIKENISQQKGHRKMKIRTSILIMALIALGSCRQQKAKEMPRSDFRLPVIIPPPDRGNVKENIVDSLDQIWPQYCGKYKFCDTLDLRKRVPADSEFSKDIAAHYSEQKKMADSLSNDGFQIFVDYKTTIIHYDYPMPFDKDSFQRGANYFPVYIVNETSGSKMFIGKDGYVYGLIEAIDTSDYERWRPITIKGFDFCGNGVYGLKVHPGEFVMFLMPKYSGNEKGRMRVRVKIGETIYLSLPFPGTFNRGQFNVKKNSFPYRALKDNKEEVIHHLFYDAVPKGYESEIF